jgi:YD repeat-containing protein
VARLLGDGTTQVFSYDYNTQGKITKVTSPSGGGTPARTTTWQYAANGIDVTAIYQQNAAGQSVDAFSVAADRLASFTYDTGGKHLVTAATDSSGRITNFTYNSFGQMLTATNALSQTTTLVYDRDDDSDMVSDGYLSSVAGPVAGAVAQFQYDGFGRLSQVTNSDNDTVTIAYEEIGGDPTKTLNRVVETTYPDSTTEQIFYELLDARFVKDRLNRWSQTRHDNLRRPILTIDPLNRVTHYQWCSCGSLEALFDPAGNQTTWIRDEQSRVTTKIFPDNTAINYEYETKTSRLKSVTDAKGQRANYQYFIDDALKELSWTDSAGAPLVPPTPTVSYTYQTAYLRVATMIDGVGTTQYGYNAVTVPAVVGAGRLATIDGPWANDTIGYVYDALGRMTEQSIDGLSNKGVTTFDTLGRVSTVTNPLGAFTYSYVGVTSRLDHVDFPNGQKSQFAYFGAAGSRRLQQIKHTDAATTVISQFDYDYNAVGNITAWTQNHAGLANPRQYIFGYDAVDQLKAATLKDTVTSGIVRDQAYRYGSAGNRTMVQDGNLIVTEASNELNQLTAVESGGMMRFAGTLNKPASVTVGGNPGIVNSDKQFRGIRPGGSKRHDPSTHRGDGCGQSGNRQIRRHHSGRGGQQRVHLRSQWEHADVRPDRYTQCDLRLGCSGSFNQCHAGSKCHRVRVRWPWSPGEGKAQWNGDAPLDLVRLDLVRGA